MEVKKRANSRISSRLQSSRIETEKTVLPRLPQPSISKQDDPIGTAKITASSVNVRKGPGTNYERIGGLTQGKSIQVYEDTGEWLKIQYGTEYGYVMQKYTDFKDLEDPLPESADSTPPNGATYTGNATIEYGANNDTEAVKTLQLYLNKYLQSSGVKAIEVDGQFGKNSMIALMYYQYSRNLCDGSGRIVVDGICGSATWNAIRTGAPVKIDISKPIAFSDGYQATEDCVLLSCGGALCKKAAAKFEELIAAAKKELNISKITLSCSLRAMTDMGTRKFVQNNSDNGQIELFAGWAHNNPNHQNAAQPGYSQHQCGKAVDFTGMAQYNDTSELYLWLKKNAESRFDFKPYDKECWHWTYKY